ncbi:hypothetical protein BegalDRAFT_2899 [Beggiatoa alba B18LD]|uniref:Tetratricopeptide repeat protein n=1 Tax=Beggiatoa alba B18LD TaxID=395493 RepID=I3CJD4_9GAMM|nr:hypothetical protein [Beggiatoa alba]EIJ43727.1 hypothetical protein BegalDRAFT_2899 [Beggiatoa alba B18LD]
MSRFFYRSLLLYGLLCTPLVITQVFANACQVTDKAKMIRLLQAVGETGSAELCAFWLAVEQAQQTNSYEAWKTVAVSHQELDAQTGFISYLKTWQQATNQNKAETYQDFMRIKPDSQFNLNAVHAIYLLAQKEDTIKAYRNFMTDFPNTPQAIEALLRIHELAYAKAQQKDKAEYYDLFVLMFPDAMQVPQAIEAAVVAEKKAILNKLGDKKCTLEDSDPLCDRLANLLFSKMLKEEQPIHVRNREFMLLKDDLFLHTSASSNAQAHQVVVQLLNGIKQQLDENNKKIDDMKQVVTDVIVAEHQQLVGLIQQQGQELKVVLKTHHDFMAQQFVQVNQQLNNVNNNINSLRNEAIVESIIKTIPIPYINEFVNPIAKIIGVTQHNMVDIVEAGVKAGITEVANIAIELLG